MASILDWLSKKPQAHSTSNGANGPTSRSADAPRSPMANPAVPVASAIATISPVEEAKLIALGKDLLDKYPDGAAPIVRGEAVNTATTYGYDSVTMMQESKTTLCQVQAA